MNLEQKVAFVTGGGRGIGRETCLLLAKQGAKVAVFSRSLSETTEVAAYITEELGGEAIALAGDVRSEDDVNNAVQKTVEKLGSIDILINNAGVMLLKPFDETTLDEWDFVQDINTRGVLLCAKAVVPQMKEKRNGVIINVSSIWGTKGGPNRSAYITSKFAVIGFT
ncbi:SDR family NAD(P)-dependent oxidoreductase, partial [Neobacillus niacini]|uniref:SDR family NAD(P)-dependent oxidoreductase n=1 Tax=Neobacillus niacini TaxID=86668 RepID=UPI00300185CE